MSQPPITSNFDPSAPEDPVNLVRMLIGDIKEPFLVSDEVILLYWEQFDQNAFAVCIPCLKIMGSHYANMADKTVGRLSISYSQLYNRAMQTANSFQNIINAGGPAGRIRHWRQNPGGVVLTGGGPKWLGDRASQLSRMTGLGQTPPEPEKLRQI